MTKHLKEELEKMEQHLQGDSEGLSIFKKLKQSVEAMDSASRGHINDQSRMIQILANRIEFYADRLDMVERPYQNVRERAFAGSD